MVSPDKNAFKHGDRISTTKGIRAKNDRGQPIDVPEGTEGEIFSIDIWEHHYAVDFGDCYAWLKPDCLAAATANLPQQNCAL